ncbi:hypothetical protein L4D76_04145 [Photobacterium sagamiensis]|uniref:hypothetical protein n=1 Tax=Photobacterium sagamiensis TaxID=2910241 RepID=UPI003D124534
MGQAYLTRTPLVDDGFAGVEFGIAFGFTSQQPLDQYRFVMKGTPAINDFLIC